METRFKRFINNRRSQSVEVENMLVRQSIPYEDSPTFQQPSTFTVKSRNKDSSKPRKSPVNHVVPLRSFSYEQCAPGKTPVFGKLPQKGNGPVKLRTSRRLSSGDLIATAQDSRRTLQDIRDGQYVIGKKERHLSHSSGKRETNFNEPQVSTASHLNHTSLIPPDSQHSSTSQTCPNTPIIACDLNRPYYQSGTSVSSTELGLGLSPSDVLNHPRQSQDSFNDTASSLSHHSMSHENPKRWRNQMPDSNATLKALRKAEYSRLVELYGLDTANNKIAQLDREHLKTPSSPAFPTDAPYSSLILEPLPLPPTDKGDTDMKRASHGSGNSEQSSDDWSGTSSPQRVSCVSSYAESSADTGQTSLTEDDSANTRESIRSMVVQLRSTYINAIDSHAAPLSKPRSKLRTKTRKSKLKPSPIIVNANDIPPLPPLPVASRQTWHPPNTESSVSSKRRVNSHPVGSADTLTLDTKSPSQSENVDTGVKRADSTTLGSLLADMTKDSKKSRKSVKPRPARDHHSKMERPVTPPLQTATDGNSWPTYNSHDSNQLRNDQLRNDQLRNDQLRNDQLRNDQLRSIHTANLQVEAHSAVIIDEAKQLHNFNATINDLDGLFSDELWTSPPYSSRNSHNHYLQQTPSQDGRTYNLQHEHTPKKTIFIPAIPESPEYTHLARDENPETNFF